MDLSLCTRVYIQGGWWASYLFEFWPVRSGTILQILIKRSLDLFQLMWWLSYVRCRYDMWCVSHLLGSDVSPNLWKDLEDAGGACLSPSYTSDKQISESRLLAIIGSPWPMTVGRCWPPWSINVRNCIKQKTLSLGPIPPSLPPPPPRIIPPWCTKSADAKKQPIRPGGCCDDGLEAGHHGWWVRVC